ncbi:MAG: topoisomerase IV, partial [Clostridiales bacterium]|nr:topoisomerase IV [Clostridiales bacterium]
MARKSKKDISETPERISLKDQSQGLPPSPPTLQDINDTLESNFMPYAMSIIVSRAIPEIDGFTPSHTKLLFTMYKMRLLTGHRTKSSN